MSINRTPNTFTGKVIAVLFFILGLFILYAWDTHKIFECYQSDRRCELHTERLIGLNSEQCFRASEIQSTSVQTESLEQGYNYSVSVSTNRYSRLEIADFPDDQGMAEATKRRVDSFIQNSSSPDLKIEEPRNLVYRYVGFGILIFSGLLFLFPPKMGE